MSDALAVERFGPLMGLVGRFIDLDPFYRDHLGEHIDRATEFLKTGIELAEKMQADQRIRDARPLIPADVSPPLEEAVTRPAAKVVPMFSEERPPVVNVRRPGRRPRNVVSIESRERLKPGDMAVVWDTQSPHCGRRVRIIGHGGYDNHRGGLLEVEFEAQAVRERFAPDKLRRVPSRSAAV